MLVLTRKPGESIVIGNDVTVTVVEVRGDQVRVGIDAPRAVKVYREEVFRQIAQENAEAAASVERARRMAGLVADRSPSTSPRQTPSRPATPRLRRPGTED